MWIITMFDLPTETKKDRKLASQFRTNLLKDGFTMFQYSVYIRNCSSKESANMHIKRVKNMLPPQGNVCLACITDKQFARMEIFYGQERNKNPQNVVQLTMF